MGIKRYKLFLASSDELNDERKEIARLVLRRNNAWTEKDVYVEVVDWHDLLHSFRGERIQDYFNREMLKCDIVVALFHKKVGQFTLEEFRIAYDNLKQGKKPNFLFVYFKSGMITIDEINEEMLKVGKLKKEIQGYEQIYGSFDSTDNLILKLQDQLDMVIYERLQAAASGQTESEKEEQAKRDLEDYRQHIRQKFRTLDFTGLNAILQKPVLLEDVYVKLRAGKSMDEQSLYEFAEIDQKFFGGARGATLQKGGGAPSPKKDNDIDFVDLFKRLHKEQGKQSLRMLLLGKPGSGKTTLMKWTALQCVSEKKTIFSRFTPMFISLKDFGKDPENTFRKKNIGTLCTDLYEKENISVESFFDADFKKNSLLFLLDGLDEIGDEKIRREAIDWIQKQYIGGNPMIVTSRISGIDRERGLRFRDEIPVFKIQDFTIEDAALFLRNWYNRVEIAAAGEQGIQQAAQQGEKRYEELIEIIKDESNKNLRELAVNPLLLTIIAVVHRTRAVLPRDRYKLYEECLKVMIELWNLANRKLDISFSFENSMDQLAKIAVRLMESENREIDKAGIEACGLPKIIEKKSRDFFLKEMVLKAGLLYESEGRYGFLHLTFQEYLAAWYYAHTKNQNDILKHHKKGYWRETFKLFVYIGNTEVFFQEIMDDLLTKEYWKKMYLWDDCLKEIAREEVRQSTELSFARRVIDILSRLEYKKENDELIDGLFTHHLLFKYAFRLEKDGWELLNNAPHPYVQSIGALILMQINSRTMNELVENLKLRIESFEKKSDESDEANLHFLLQNKNSFLILFYSRWKLNDYYYAFTKHKSTNILLRFLSIYYLNDIDIIMNREENKQVLDIINIKSIREIVYPRQNSLSLYIKSTYIGHLGYVGPSEKALKRYMMLRNENPGIKILSEIYAIFKREYRDIISKRLGEIDDWTDRAIEKLHSLPDKKLLELFPNTTKEELEEFRASYVEVIANELSKGNCDILLGKKLTEEKQKKVAELVSFKYETVVKMLDFTLDTEHEEEKHAHHILAFEILKLKDFIKIREIVETIIRSHPDRNRIALNGLYILKMALLGIPTL
ncbi:MAG: NACHT domain-containing protein [Candidatus Aminicenantes bacterium]|nr:NACHT domain-containing protein [Candidatus Aminicenantes bacterium]